MAFDESLAGRIRDALARKKGIVEKKMFGGVGYFLHGNMLVGVWKDSLIARLGPDNYDDALLEPHVRAFDITGRAMRGWVLVDPEGVEEDQLTNWIERVLKFVKGRAGPRRHGGEGRLAGRHGRHPGRGPAEAPGEADRGEEGMLVPCLFAGHRGLAGSKLRQSIGEKSLGLLVALEVGVEERRR